MISRKDATPRSALADAVHLLSRRSLSVGEMRSRLAALGHEGDDVDSCIQNLAKRGYLNDAALCGTLTDKYLRQGKYSRYVVSQKLRQRGFDSEIVKEALQEWPEEEEWRQALVLLEKRFSRRPVEKGKEKMMRYLSSRGFAATAIRRAMEGYTQEPIDPVE